MTPEEDMERAVRAVCPASGHWPYTKDAAIYCGWRPAEDRGERASGRSVRVRVTYDLILCRRRGAGLAAEAERMRFALYKALRDSGWTIVDCGPEAFAEATQMFFWPITASKGFGVGEDGQPYALTEGTHEPK